MRSHHDVDVAVLRDDQLALRARLAGWQWTLIERGAARPWGGEQVVLPVHELVAAKRIEAGEAPSDDSIEILLNERIGDDWVFRRDPRVRRALSRAFVEAACGVPVLAPEIVLLYKAKRTRPIDEADFAACAPALPQEARAWLAGALAICAPEHPWLAALA